MKTYVRTVLIAFCFFTHTASANPAPCSMATLAGFMAPGFSCSIGDKVFSNFTYSQKPPPGTQIDPSNINVTPVNTPNNPGLNFQNAGSWNAGGGTSSSLVETIEFLVTVMPGGEPIDDASLELMGIAVDGAGVVSDSESLCPGGPIVGCTATNPPSLYASSNLGNPAPVTFPPVMQIGVSDELTIAATTGSDAHLSSFQKQFSEVPEPTSAVLLATALAAASLTRFRTVSLRQRRPRT